MIALRPLLESEYAAWDDAHRAEYAHGLIEHVGMSPERAAAKVARDLGYVLPEGFSTPGARVWAVESDGRRVGTVFVGCATAAPGCTTSRSTRPSGDRATVGRR